MELKLYKYVMLFAGVFVVGNAFGGRNSQMKNTDESDGDSTQQLFMFLEDNQLQKVVDLVTSGKVNVDSKNEQGLSILEVVVDKHLEDNSPDLGNLRYNRLKVIECLLFNNVQFNNTTYQKVKGKADLQYLFTLILFLYNQCIQLKARDCLHEAIISNKKEINIDGRIFTVGTSSFVAWAIHRNLRGALKYCIEKNYVFASDLFMVMAHYQNLPLDMFEYFWNLTKDKERKEVFENAVKKNNKKFINAVNQYNLWQQKRNKMCYYWAKSGPIYSPNSPICVVPATSC